MTIQFLPRAFASTRILAVVLLLVVAFVAGPAWAAVGLRVEGRPISNPIQAYVRVTDANGAVQGLVATNFAVMLDGTTITMQPADVTLPPDQDPNQKVSVVFVMDYTSSVTDSFLAEMESSVIAFIDAMNVGDYAAIIKFNNDTGANVVQPFIDIDEGANDQLLTDAVLAAYPGDGSNIIDATNLAVEHMTTQLPTLPAGPKAVILVTDGIDSHSSGTADDVISAANGSGIPIFTIGVGNPNQNGLDLLTSLATDTGGEFIPAPTGPDITDAYLSVSESLNGEYLLTIPLAISDPIIGDDCDVHAMDVTVAPHGSASAAFTRRICDTVPDDFSFIDVINVAVDSIVTSNIVTISGIEEAPAEISVLIGSYSIGCNGTFTRDPGMISDGETVCVRHTSSAAGSTTNTTTLTIGGVSGAFSSTTRAAQGGGGGGGGGGATGGVELLLGLVALMARRRRRV